MRKRIPDPKPPRTKSKTAEDWYDVHYMDVYSQKTKKGDMAVVVSFREEYDELGLSPRDEKTWTDDLLETAIEMITSPAPTSKVDDDDLPF